MATMQSNQFEFVNAGSDMSATVLNAVMADFSYAEQAHDELALGVTLQGVQEFHAEAGSIGVNRGN